MAYRNKTYVCFDGDSDILYYYLMCAWKQNDNIAFDFYNAHDLNSARDSSQELSIKAQLNTRLMNSKVMIVLIGENTKNLHRFVRWEMEQAISRKMPIIAVNLNDKRSLDVDRCPPIIREELVVHIPFNAQIIQYALENWPASHSTHSSNGVTGPRLYIDSIYKSLGLATA